MLGLQLYSRLPQLTLALILISVIITLLTEFGRSNNSAIFMISVYRDQIYNLIEIRNGEIWRLVSPIFIHLSIMHIIFNMMWLWDLGGKIEDRQGRINLVSQVIIYGIAGNLAQYYFSGSNFGGMSGVVYGLLAYIWVQSKFNPRSGLFIQKEIVIMMFIWYLVCWTGVVGPIANMAHTGGLLLGLILGFSHVKLLRN